VQIFQVDTPPQTDSEQLRDDAARLIEKSVELRKLADEVMERARQLLAQTETKASAVRDVQ
jgi:hypothetical protein